MYRFDGVRNSSDLRGPKQAQCNPQQRVCWAEPSCLKRNHEVPSPFVDLATHKNFVFVQCRMKRITNYGLRLKER